MSHSGQGIDVQFEVQWTTGDVTWLSYAEAKHLEPLKAYCEAMGIKHPKDLPKRMSHLPDEVIIGVASTALRDESKTMPQKYLHKDFRYKGRENAAANCHEHAHIHMTDNQQPTNFTRPAEAFFSAESLAILLATQKDAYVAGANAVRNTPRFPQPNDQCPCKKGNKHDHSHKKGKNAPLKDRVDGGNTAHLLKPLGKRRPSKSFKAWSHSEPEIINFVDNLIDKFANLRTEKEKPHNLGTEPKIMAAIQINRTTTMINDMPVIGPSNTVNHGSTSTTETNEHVNWGIPAPTNEQTDSQTVTDVAMEEFNVIVGDVEELLHF